MLRSNWRIGPFVGEDEDGVKAGIEGNIKTNEGSAQGSVHYNFSKETPEVQGKFSDRVLGEGKIKWNEKEFDGSYRLPRKIRNYIYENAAAIGVLCGIISYASNTNPDVIYKISEALANALIFSLGTLYVTHKLASSLHIKVF